MPAWVAGNPANENTKPAATRSYRHRDLNTVHCWRQGAAAVDALWKTLHTLNPIDLITLIKCLFWWLHSLRSICRVAWWEARLINPLYCLPRKPDVGGGGVDASSKAQMEPRPQRRRRRRAGLESPRIAQITEVVEDRSLIIPIFKKLFPLNISSHSCFYL